MDALVGCVGWMGPIKILVEAVCSQTGEHVSTEANGRPSRGVCALHCCSCDGGHILSVFHSLPLTDAAELSEFGPEQ